MIDEEDRFVIPSSGSTPRWVVHRPIDPYGEGYVHTMLVELSDEGLTASGHATFEGRTPENLQDFLLGLAKDWRGWPGVRSWTSMDGEMTLEAGHDGRAYVSIAVTLRDCPHDPGGWSARIVLSLEAGEELRRLADTAERFLHP
ncbi:hypothetical protein SAMN04489712_105521 [Thermomonospora echinospora]|uniref:Uncharacterized protein n=1 Tax=Thermomonospora echinospora TaxID=1992 RepID=A0A1H6AKE9_9ACTN|nr:DUF6228 family protein [Thermomonospora echinospora]SEG49223.1 hypothetical protein SAMN04489712_105521 [Thermomonospora echinospora]